MTTVQKHDSDTPTILEQVVIGGDLSKLSSADRLTYYRQVCESLGINPLTKPFQYIHLNGKLTLYASRDATDQLRKRDKISIEIVGAPILVNGVYIVTAKATTPDGRSDTEIGAVTVENLKGDALANAMMKAMTKAKRRVTLSIVGLGWLDETEIETIPDARPLTVDQETGEIQESKSIEARPQGEVEKCPACGGTLSDMGALLAHRASDGTWHKFQKATMTPVK